MSGSKFLPFILSLTCSTVLFGQDAATLSGSVVDSSKAGVPGAEVTLLEVHRGVIRHTVTNSGGIYLFDSLAPGEYTLEVVKAGFSKLKVEHVHLKLRDRQSLQVELAAASVEQTVVTVAADTEGISYDSSIGAAINHGYAEHLPLNGRNVQSLLSMSPGVVNASSGRGGRDQLNVNGLHSNANYYTLDGLNAEIGIGLQGAGGGFRATGGVGADGRNTNSLNAASLASLDAIEEVRVQTSTLAPEFGRSPGSQISVVSRAGSNAVHGSLSEYFRTDRVNANDWFANRDGIPRGKMRLNNFGGVLGGPVVRNQTYFFASYEGLRLRQSETAVADVPAISTRQSAPLALQPYLNSFPVPNGPEVSDGAARFSAVFTTPSRADSASLRLDHTFNDRLSGFVRYVHAPSQSEFRAAELTSPNVLSEHESKAHSLTASLAWGPTPQTTNNFRVNVSRASASSTSTMDGLGGAVPLTDGVVFPGGITGSNGEFILAVAGMGGYSHRVYSKDRQNQVNVVNHITTVQGTSTFKFGVDYRRLAPTYFRKPYGIVATFNGLSGDAGSLLSGNATTAVVSSSADAVYPLFVNYSVYGQGTWKATNRTTLTYGLRWDVNPAPDVRDGPPPVALAASGEAPSVTRFEPFYGTKWADIAPRFGLAYQMDTEPGREMIFRTGIGLFYDIGYGATAGLFSGAPYASERILTSASFPLSAENLQPPTLPARRPYGRVSAVDPWLESPKVYQWSATVERMFGSGQSLSVGLVGIKGRKLLRVESRPSFSEDYDLLQIATNGAESDYRGLQVQFRRRLRRNFQTQISYTYSHSIDTASSHAAGGGGRAGFATLFGNERGDSDFDVRHNLSFSGSFNLPAPKASFLRPLFGGWWFDWVVTARTGLPFDVQGISATTSGSETDGSSSTTPAGLFAQIRPDYTGEPVWLDDPVAPGGRRLNPDAFVLPSEYEQGNLSRNVLRGFDASQVDFSLRRQIAVSERLSIQIAAQAFNILNHPNFANLSPNEGANLSSPSFGLATRMLSDSFGGGFGSLYRMGGARSLQLALRLEF